MANRKHPKTTPSYPEKCAFQIAIEHTEDVKDGFRTGKQAIKKTDREKIAATDNGKLQGSLDIDSEVKTRYPEDPRWDYALSYDNETHFFEIHPADTSEVDKVVEKAKWLKKWLKNNAPEIDRLPKAEHPYIWIQSGHFAILPTSKNNRKLSTAGITITNKLTLK